MALSPKKFDGPTLIDTMFGAGGAAEAEEYARSPAYDEARAEEEHREGCHAHLCTPCSWGPTPRIPSAQQAYSRALRGRTQDPRLSPRRSIYAWPPGPVSPAAL